MTNKSQTTPEKFEIEKPEILYFLHEGKTPICHMWPKDDQDYRHFGLMIADIICTVANHFNVNKLQVMKWVEKELHHPTNKMEKPQ